MKHNENVLSSAQVQELLNISNGQLLRTWADTFKSYLSDEARGGDGRHRKFTFDDLAVLALISEMREERQPYDEIGKVLASGQRGVVPIPPELDLAVIAASQQNILLARKVFRLEEERRGLVAQIMELQQKIDPAQAEIQRLIGAEQTLKEELAQLRGQLMAFAQLAQQSYRDGFKDGLGFGKDEQPEKEPSKPESPAKAAADE